MGQTWLAHWLCCELILQALRLINGIQLILNFLEFILVLTLDKVLVILQIWFSGILIASVKCTFDFIAWFKWVLVQLWIRLNISLRCIMAQTADRISSIFAIQVKISLGCYEPFLACDRVHLNLALADKIYLFYAALAVFVGSCLSISKGW